MPATKRTFRKPCSVEMLAVLLIALQAKALFVSAWVPAPQGHFSTRSGYTQSIRNPFSSKRYSSSLKSQTTQPQTELQQPPLSKNHERNDSKSSKEYELYESKKLDLQLLLLDNYDSYTYNIYSYLCTMCKHPPIVVSNDAYETWEDLAKNVGVDIDAIVISPGPGRPERKEDMGVCLEVSCFWSKLTTYERYILSWLI